MGIFTKLAKRYLQKNKVRTIVTLIGITISMALFTAVIEGAYSGYSFLFNREIENVGSWHALFYDVNEEGYQKLQESDEIKVHEAVYDIGWAKADNNNDGKPYLLVKSLNDQDPELFPIEVISGRLPQNEQEIVLPDNFLRASSEKIAIGDTITLDIGDRYFEKEKMGEYNPYMDEEIIQDVRSHTFTVVGIMERLRYEIENYSCPGYTCFTKDMQSAHRSVFVEVKNPDNFNKFMVRQSIADSFTSHSNLMRLLGSFQVNQEKILIFGFAAVLVGLIVYGSISLIYNAFAISVSERIQQFGILKSIGASDKQLRRLVLAEAGVLAVIGIVLGIIVGCLGIGITLYWVQKAFISNLLAHSKTELKLVINIVPIMIAVGICYGTTMISAYLPAYKAIRIPAIDAIRQHEDIVIRKNEVKTSPIVGKLFGFAGVMAAKNFKRNKRKYRSTIISLTLSIVLFISASALTEYVKKTTISYAGSDNQTSIVYHVSDSSEQEYDFEHGAKKQRFQAIQSIEGIDDILMEISYHDDIYIQRDNVTMEYWTPTHQQNVNKIRDHVGVTGILVFIDDDSFAELCKENGIDSSAYFDVTAPKGLLQNHVISQEYLNQKMLKVEYDIVDKALKDIPMFIQYHKYMEGYTSNHEIYIEAGKQFYLFYPTEYIEENEGFENLDMNYAVKYPVEEMTQELSLTAGEQIKQNLFSLSSEYMALIYPISMRTHVFGEDHVTYIDRYRPTATISLRTKHHADVMSMIDSMKIENHWEEDMVFDLDKDRETNRTFILVVNVFAYGFIILIAMIAIANVFNTISTNITLRRKEFAMLRSVGMSKKDFSKMMNYECVIYGIRSLSVGLPISVAVSYIIYRIVSQALAVEFFIPYKSILIAVGAVFVVVFVTMLYATGKIRKNNVIEELRMESI